MGSIEDQVEGMPQVCKEKCPELQRVLGMAKSNYPQTAAYGQICLAALIVTAKETDCRGRVDVGDRYEAYVCRMSNNS